MLSTNTVIYYFTIFLSQPFFAPKFVKMIKQNFVHFLFFVFCFSFFVFCFLFFVFCFSFFVFCFSFTPT